MDRLERVSVGLWVLGWSFDFCFDVGVFGEIILSLCFCVQLFVGLCCVLCVVAILHAEHIVDD